jgi:hypothetical protein
MPAEPREFRLKIRAVFEVVSRRYQAVRSVVQPRRT